jgi:tetratricopeptide (TPR) repeat protein
MIGTAWAALGDDERAEMAFERSMELQPDVSWGCVGMCRLRVQQGRLEEAILRSREAQARYVGDMTVDEGAALASFSARDYAEAERIYTALAAKDPEGGMRHDSNVSYASALGWIRTALGDRERGRELLEQCRARELAALARAPQSREIIYRVAAVEASLGHTDAALGWLEKAVEAGWIDHRSLQHDPRFDLIAAEPRFHAIMNRIVTRVAELRRQIASTNPALN